MVFVNERDKHRTIDYERNIVMTTAAPPYPGMTMTEYFQIEWNGSKMSFGTDYAKNNPDGSWTIDWTITSARISEEWQQNKPLLIELKKIVIEAMEAYAYYFGRQINDGQEVSGPVNIHFSPHVASFNIVPDQPTRH